MIQAELLALWTIFWTLRAIWKKASYSHDPQKAAKPASPRSRAGPENFNDKHLRDALEILSGVRNPLNGFPIYCWSEKSIQERKEEEKKARRRSSLHPSSPL